MYMLQQTEEMSDFLQDQGISADFYHAGQTPQQRKVVQAAWSTGLVKVLITVTHNRRYRFLTVMVTLNLSCSNGV
jgi:superfamily II helicase